jgi:hypothetical protein
VSEEPHGQFASEEQAASEAPEITVTGMEHADEGGWAAQALPSGFSHIPFAVSYSHPSGHSEHCPPAQNVRPELQQSASEPHDPDASNRTRCGELGAAA